MTDRAPSSGPPDLPEVPMADPNAPKHWLVRPATIRLLWVASCVILALFVGADFFVHGHAYFGLDGTFGFYAWFGFFTCVAMVVGAKVLGIFLKRKDSYYD